jgi:hypothetical protein
MYEAGDADWQPYPLHDSPQMLSGRRSEIERS